VIEHAQGRNTRINPEFLGQITEGTAQRILVSQHIDVAQADAAAIGFL